MTRKKQVVMIHKVLLAAVVLATAIDYVTAADWNVTIQVANKLSNGKVLIVHCKSGDDDLGGHAVEANATYSWTFDQNIFGGTFFWCDLAFRDKRVSFTAFDQKDRTLYVQKFDVSEGGVDGYDRYSGEQVHVCDWKNKH